jgi:hypothetical protein
VSVKRQVVLFEGLTAARKRIRALGSDRRALDRQARATASAASKERARLAGERARG